MREQSRQVVWVLLNGLGLTLIVPCGLVHRDLAVSVALAGSQGCVSVSVAILLLRLFRA